MLQFLPLVLRYGKVIAAAVALGSIALYAMNAEKNRGLVKMLEAETARHIQTIAHQDEQIRSLHGQIRRNNELTLERLEQERARLLEVKAEVERVQSQRDAITAELAKARQDWLESIQDDESVREFITLPVPDAVWRRLRGAAG